MRRIFLFSCWSDHTVRSYPRHLRPQHPDGVAKRQVTSIYVHLSLSRHYKQPVDVPDHSTLLTLMPEMNRLYPQLVAVSIRLPTLWAADPELWFAQAEQEFSRRNITTQMIRFREVITSGSPHEGDAFTLHLFTYLRTSLACDGWSPIRSFCLELSSTDLSLPLLLERSYRLLPKCH